MLFFTFPFQFANVKFKAFITASSSPWEDFNHYHNYTEIVNILLYLNDTYPNVVDVFSIGKSWNGREIYCIRLTNEFRVRSKPQVLFVGYHHARELISAELPLYFAVEAATSFGSNETITYMLNYSEIYIIPALNVDGFDVVKQNEWQRKNAHSYDDDGDGLFDEDPPDDEDGDGYIEDLFFWNGSYYEFIRWEGADDDGDGLYNEDWIGGVDLNRNYGYQWNASVQSGSPYPQDEDYRGPAPFSEPETQAFRDFAFQHDFKYAISFHSGAECVVYPWGYTAEPPTDEEIFIEVASEIADITDVWYGQSGDWYTTSGVWDDWMYGNRSTFAFTCEIYKNDSAWQIEPGPLPNTWWERGIFEYFNPAPSDIVKVIQRWLPIFIYITNRSIYKVRGPRSSRLNIKFYSPSALFDALWDNETDLIHQPLSHYDYHDVTTDPEIVLASYNTSLICEFDLNNNDTIADHPNILSPTSVLEVRQAIAHLIDKYHIISDIMNYDRFGLESFMPIRIDVPLPLTQSSWWNTSVIYSNYLYVYSPDSAAQKLASIGFNDTDGDGWLNYPDWWPGAANQDTTVYPLKVYIRNDSQPRLLAGYYLVDQLENALRDANWPSNYVGGGFKCEVTEGNRYSITPIVMRDQNYHIYTGAWNLGRLPYYLYFLFHSKFWSPGTWSSNYVTGTKYPDLDDALEKAYFADSLDEAMIYIKKVQSLLVDKYCVSIWLWGRKCYAGYRNLLGIVNVDGCGLLNRYTFMNTYVPSENLTAPIRVGIETPSSMNILYSTSPVLDCIYESGLSYAPYNITIDQPWLFQYWRVGWWIDPETGENKTKITYWLRKDSYWIEPVTGAIGPQFKTSDYEFTIWYIYQTTDSWHYNSFMDIHHVRVIDDFCVEVYMDLKSCWALYMPTGPFLPKYKWLREPLAIHTITCFQEWINASTPGQLFLPYQEQLAPVSVENITVQFVNGTTRTLERYTEWDMIKGRIYIYLDLPDHTKIYVDYWGRGDAHGYTPGNMPWDEILVGNGMYYLTDFVSGVGGYALFNKNPFYFLETPILGEIDWIWIWEDEKSLVGYYEVSMNDFDITTQAYGSSGTGVPDPGWFPGADLVLPIGEIGLGEWMLVVHRLLEMFGIPPPATIRDISILNIDTKSKTIVGEGFLISINITLKNQGETTEQFNLAVYANTTEIILKNIELTAGNLTTFTFTWNTTGFAKGNYTISAYAWPVPGETDTADNKYIDGSVILTIPGDVDGSFSVDGGDLGLLGIAWYSQPGDPNWNPNADIDGSERINGGDLGILGLNWFKTDP